MGDAKLVSGEIAGTDRTISFEAGELALQAGGAVTVRVGDTSVLVTATTAPKARPGADFFPLTVDVEERFYAVGRIPGSFFRREGRASDQAILTCRLTDRPLRPCFPDGFRNEVHVVGLVLSADLENPHDVLIINGASAALSASSGPFSGPIGAVRLAYSSEGDWIAHPTYEEIAEATFDMVVAGRVLDDGDVAIMMVEAGGTEASWPAFESGAPKVDEAVIADGLDASKPHIAQAVALQHELVEALGKPETMEYEVAIDYTDEVLAAVEAGYGDKIAEVYTIADKQERAAAEETLRDEVLEALTGSLTGEDGDEVTTQKQIKSAFRSVAKERMRTRIVTEGTRMDGRSATDIRPLSAQVGVVPKVHGSGLFQRGETQVLNVATLGMSRMEQMLDTLGVVDRKRYLHHYNFPPFSTGETGFMRGPKRREVGHGALAERAIVPVLPDSTEFPYTIRTVSDVLASNGSSSMASVCGSSLSLMDAGVPIKAPVAGIAMGLIFKDGEYVSITDILGAEDAMGDMDFKIAGTSEFVTAMQLDTKIDGIPADVLAQALQQAKEARLAILGVMAEAIDGPRDEVNVNAPKIVSFEIPIDKIGEVIGPKGKVINAIQQETGADIGVDDDGSVGVVSIGSTDSGAVAEAQRQIELILHPPTAELNEDYDGTVVNITKFGAFVNILPGRDGLVHISKLGDGKRIDRVEDVLSLGDEIKVRVDDIDQNGKVSLTPLGENGEPLASSGGGGGGGRGGRGGRDRDRGGRDRGDRGRGQSRDRDGGGDADDSSSGTETVSFEDAFDKEMRDEFGDLGPTGGGGGGGGGRGRGGRGRRRD